MKETLVKKIEDKSVIIGIIGLGYVGLPLGLTFVEKGIKVIGFDIDEKKIPILNNGASYIKHIPSERIKKAVDSKLFEATSDFSLLASCDAILICVPTPLDEHREPDISYVENSAITVAQYLRKGQLVVLESSTYPGTTEEILLPLFENKQDDSLVIPNPRPGGGACPPLREESLHVNLKVGHDFFLAFSPEREDPNNPDFETATIPKVVGGVTPPCLEVACKLYDLVIVKTVPVSSPRAAEATKLLENIYRSVNIALVNELKMVFDRMEIDVWEVIEAAKTKPFGYHPFYPGPGLGGHCIPIDPFYLTWKAREYDISTKFIELAGEINTFQPYYVVERTRDYLNEKLKKSLSGSKVLILGAAYKKNIDDMRESPTLKLIEILRAKGAEVDYNDPFVPKLPPSRKYKFDMISIELTAENLSRYDVVLLSTDHDFYKENSKLIIQNSKLILDTRNALTGENVYKA
ncbi:MAG: nucleotide sugar dehydrogenase [Melioribacteraceae bacterium]|nr:nucleotide sugar dehydrogenase [Melioribacteraceae bacterium]